MKQHTFIYIFTIDEEEHLLPMLVTVIRDRNVSQDPGILTNHCL